MVILIKSQTLCHEVLSRGLSEGAARAEADRWMCDRLNVSDFSLSGADRLLHHRLMNHFTSVTNLSASVVAGGIMAGAQELEGDVLLLSLWLFALCGCSL